MSDQAIRKAFEAALAAMAPPLPTVYQGQEPPRGFDATKAHQKCWLLPDANKSLGLAQNRTLQKGIFQVNLCYPSGIGASDADTRATALQTHFYAGRILEVDGVKVRVTGRPDRHGPSSISPYTVPVSIRYQSIN